MSEQPRRQSRANTPQTNRHLTGRYRSDAPPPAERGRPEDRVQRPGCFLMIGLLVAGASAALVAVIALFFLLRPTPTMAQNAVWLGISWGGGERTEAEIDQLATLFKAEAIGTVYVWTTWLQEDGTWSDTTFDYMPTFLERFRAGYPEARLEAWIGLPVDAPEYRLDDTEVRATVTAFAGRAITEFGFDGVHLNAEPVWEGDASYLDLLREMRQVIGPDVSLSVAVPPDWNTGAPGIPVGAYTTPDAHWSQEYKQRVAFLVDEIAIMAYNSGLTAAQDYQTWMAFQVTQYVSAIAALPDINTRLIVGIPTYDAELPGHDPAVESVPAAISGIRQGIAQSGDDGAIVEGVGIYAEWSTDAAEWVAYRQYWVQQAEFEPAS